MAEVLRDGGPVQLKGRECRRVGAWLGLCIRDAVYPGIGPEVVVEGVVLLDEDEHALDWSGRARSVGGRAERRGQRRGEKEREQEQGRETLRRSQILTAKRTHASIYGVTRFRGLVGGYAPLTAFTTRMLHILHLLYMLPHQGENRYNFHHT